MATATRPTTQTMSKPVVCARCKTTHFSYQLSCKRCGDYLHKDDSIAESKARNLQPVFMGAGGLIIALFIACFAFRVL